MRYWIAIVFALACSPALAQQSIRQSGHVTPGHIVQWTTNGVVQDGGTAANGTLSSIGTTGLGPTICANSGPVTGPYQQTCLGSTSTGGLLSLQNYGGAASGSLVVTANGTSVFSLGSTGTNFTAPILFNGSLPASASATVLCENSVGVLSFGCASGGGSGVSSLNSLTGALNITAGTNITVTPSGSSIQISSSGSGSGTVNSGTANQLGYYASSGTTISGLTSTGNGILITNGSGVPSWGTQSGLTTASSLTSATVPVFISTGAVQQATVGTLQAGTGISITGTTTVSIGLNGTISGSSGIFATASGTLTNGDCVSINNGSFIDAGGACTTGGGGGTVSSGLSNQLAYYASNGTVVGGLATCSNGIIGTTAGSVPQCETTLPAGLTVGNLTLSGTLTAASLSTSGTVAGSLCRTSGGLVLYEAGTNCYSSSLVVGGSSVTGGTNGYFLTTGTGTLANVAPTGTGNVVLASAPTIAGLTITTSLTATGLVTVADLQVINGNSVLGNGSNSIVSPTALSVPSCSAASSALTWTSGTGFGCNTISAALPVCLISGGNSSTDFTSAFNTCLSGFPAYGGQIQLAAANGAYCIKTGPVIVSQAYVQIVGTSSQAQIAACGVDNTLFSLDGPSVILRNLFLTCYQAPSDPNVSSGTITAPANNCLNIVSASGSLNCDDCALEHVTVMGGNIGILNVGAEVKMYDVHILFGYGIALLESTPGTYSGGSLSAWALFADNNWPSACGGPLSSQTSVSGWTASTSFTACTTVSEGSYYYQTESSCTSGSTAPTLHAYRQGFSDGGCTWQLVSNVSLAAYYNHGAKENYLINLDTTGGALNSILVDNGAEFFRCEMCIASQSIGASVVVSSGSYIFFNMPEIGSQLNASGTALTTSGSFAGPLTFQSGYMAGNSYAANLTVGSWTTIANMFLSGGSNGAVSIGTSKVTVTGNQLNNPFGASVAIQGNSELYANVTNNTCGGSYATCANGLTGTGSTNTGNN
jgi:hypothetical protein